MESVTGHRGKHSSGIFLFLFFGDTEKSFTPTTPPPPNNNNNSNSNNDNNDNKPIAKPKKKASLLFANKTIFAHKYHNLQCSSLKSRDKAGNSSPSGLIKMKMKPNMVVTWAL